MEARGGHLKGSFKGAIQANGQRVRREEILDPRCVADERGLSIN